MNLSFSLLVLVCCYGCYVASDVVVPATDPTGAVNAAASPVGVNSEHDISQGAGELDIVDSLLSFSPVLVDSILQTECTDNVCFRIKEYLVSHGKRISELKEANTPHLPDPKKPLGPEILDSKWYAFPEWNVIKTTRNTLDRAINTSMTFCVSVINKINDIAINCIVATVFGFTYFISAVVFRVPYVVVFICRYPIVLVVVGVTQFFFVVRTIYVSRSVYHTLLLQLRAADDALIIDKMNVQKGRTYADILARCRLVRLETPSMFSYVTSLIYLIPGMPLVYVAPLWFYRNVRDHLNVFSTYRELEGRVASAAVPFDYSKHPVAFVSDGPVMVKSTFDDNEAKVAEVKGKGKTKRARKIMIACNTAGFGGTTGKMFKRAFIARKYGDFIQYDEDGHIEKYFIRDASGRLIPQEPTYFTAGDDYFLEDEDNQFTLDGVYYDDELDFDEDVWRDDYDQYADVDFHGDVGQFEPRGGRYDYDESLVAGGVTFHQPDTNRKSRVVAVSRPQPVSTEPVKASDVSTVAAKPAVVTKEKEKADTQYPATTIYPQYFVIDKTGSVVSHCVLCANHVIMNKHAYDVADAVLVDGTKYSIPSKCSVHVFGDKDLVAVGMLVPKQQIPVTKLRKPNTNEYVTVTDLVNGKISTGLTTDGDSTAYSSDKGTCGAPLVARDSCIVGFHCADHTAVKVDDEILKFFRPTTANSKLSKPTCSSRSTERKARAVTHYSRSVGSGRGGRGVTATITSH